ncbi:hypothetical protein ACFJGW_16860 [Burkholderiaceae bacterium UC74_6]
MSFEHDFDALNQRIAKAERERDAWRAVGVAGEERYLEACSNVGALSLQLERLCEEQGSMATRLPGRSAGHR